MSPAQVQRRSAERSRGQWTFLLGALLAMGCGSGSGDNGNPQTPADMAQLPPDMSYPAGPYGPDVDSVLPNLTFQGYFSPSKTSGLASDEKFGTVTFDMLRGTGAKVAVMQIAAYWCGPCLTNAKALVEQTAPYAGKGMTTMLVLTEGTSPTGPAATRNNLDSWIQRAQQPFTATLDSVAPQTPLEEYFSVPRDHFFVIDLATMKLLNVYDSNPTAAVEEAASLIGP